MTFDEKTQLQNTITKLKIVFLLKKISQIYLYNPINLLSVSVLSRTIIAYLFYGFILFSVFGLKI